MKANLLSFLFLAVTLGGCMPSDNTFKIENGLRSKIVTENKDNEQMNIHERMSHYMAPAVSIAIVDDSKIKFAKGYGEKTLNKKGKEITTKNLFLAGSISKTITAFGALMLVQQGKLSLDEDVNQYLKSWKVKENEFTTHEKVTLRRLLSHSAGMSVHGFPGYTVKSKIPNIVEILDGKLDKVNTKPVEVIFSPGSKFQYSGGGTTIVQLIIEDITEKEFGKWMQDNVLEPMGMHSSTFEQPLSESKSDDAVFGHNAKGEMVEGKWHVYPEKAAAGLWTTPYDLAKFMISFFKILDNETNAPLNSFLANEMISPQMKISKSGHAGLGVFLEGEKKALSFSHDGADEGFIARFEAYPNQKKGMVIMVNNDGAFQLIDEISHSIADAFNIPGYKKTYKKSIKFDLKKFPDITGNYHDDENEISIIEKNNHLFITQEGTQDNMLHLGEKGRFFMSEDLLEIEYLASKNQIHIYHPANKHTDETKEIYVKAHPLDGDRGAGHTH